MRDWHDVRVIPNFGQVLHRLIAMVIVVYVCRLCFNEARYVLAPDIVHRRGTVTDTDADDKSGDND